MRNNNLIPIVILALNLDSEELEQQAISTFLGSEYSRPSLVGCYKGEVERSYIIETTSKSLEDILMFAKQYNQESILHLDNERSAVLVYDMDNMVKLGRFKSASKAIALSNDAYTYSKETHTYYIVE
jgi:hypothetical protein